MDDYEYDDDDDDDAEVHEDGLGTGHPTRPQLLYQSTTMDLRDRKSVV